MNRLTSMLLPALALIAASPAAAQTWRIAGEGGEAPNRSVYLLDSSSIQRNGATVKFRTSTVFESLTADRDWDNSVTWRQGSCIDMASQVIDNNFYSGTSLLQHDTQVQNMVTHGPTSIMRGVLDIACGTGDYESGVVGDRYTAAKNWFSANP
jgi:hypothetical protein